jgi:hypothetical protein
MERAAWREVFIAMRAGNWTITVEHHDKANGSYYLTELSNGENTIIAL